MTTSKQRIRAIRGCPENNEGIEDRVATFETRPRTAEDIRGWFGGNYPVVIVEQEGEAIAFFLAIPRRGHTRGRCVLLFSGDHLDW